MRSALFLLDVDLLRCAPRDLGFAGCCCAAGRLWRWSGRCHLACHAPIPLHRRPHLLCRRPRASGKVRRARPQQHRPSCCPMASCGRCWWAGAGVSSTTRVLKASLAAQGSHYSATWELRAGQRRQCTGPAIPVAASVVDKGAGGACGHGYRRGEPGAGLAGALRQPHPASRSGRQLERRRGPGRSAPGGGCAQGRITGSRTTGCTYTGQLSLRAERKAV